MYIQLTNIDAQTKIPCTDEPMRTGPALPEVQGFKIVFANESDYPIALNADGSYEKPTRYYGICDDDADTTLSGVIEVMTNETFESARLQEYNLRQPYHSWIGDIETMSWQPPITYPQDGKQYQWDESIINWVEVCHG